jgi:hypothetical protein
MGASTGLLPTLAKNARVGQPQRESDESKGWASPPSGAARVGGGRERVGRARRGGGESAGGEGERVAMGGGLEQVA